MQNITVSSIKYVIQEYILIKTQKEKAMSRYLYRNNKESKENFICTYKRTVLLYTIPNRPAASSLTSTRKLQLTENGCLRSVVRQNEQTEIMQEFEKETYNKNIEIVNSENVPFKKKKQELNTILLTSINSPQRNGKIEKLKK